MKRFNKIVDTLQHFGISCALPYYVSTGNQFEIYPEGIFQIDFFLICVVLNGESIIEVDNQKYKMTADNIFIAAPSTMISLTNISNNFKVKFIFFEKTFLLKNLNDPFVMDRFPFFKERTYDFIPITTLQKDELVKILNHLSYRTSNTRRYRDEIARTIIFNIVLEIAEVYNSSIKEIKYLPGVPKHLYLKFVMLVKENIFKSASVHYYAEKLHVSNKYLIEFVKAASGKTPHQIINGILFKEALILLANPNLNLSEIAGKLHFHSLSSFSRFFKQNYGNPPSAYLNKIKMQ